MTPMAPRAPRFVPSLATQISTRCSSLSSSLSIFVSPFSSAVNTGESPSNPVTTPGTPITSSRNSIDEQFVLEQLADLVPVYRPFSANMPTERRDGPRRIDDFLSPADKLRGIFLQKPKGRAAVEAALSAVGVEPTEETVAEVLNRGNLGGEAMVCFFNWAIKCPRIGTDAKIYQIVLKALGRRKFFDYMELVLDQMKREKMHPDVETLMIVMDSYVRARRICKAVEFFGQLGEFGLMCDAESLNVLLQCLCRRAHVGAADSLLGRMKGKISINGTSYDVVIGGWSRLGKVNEIERNLKTMAAEGFEPSCLTFSYLIEGLGRAGRLSESLQVVDKMEMDGCTPGTVTFKAIIFNFISVGNYDEAMKYYKMMSQRGFEPNLDTYVKLINAFVKVRRVADALEVFDGMLDKGMLPTTGAITSFLEPLCSFGPPYAAAMVYKKAKKLGCKISLKAYKLLLMRLSRFGKCGMLLKLWEEMQEDGFSSDREVYEYIINGFCNIGQLENAVFAMEEGLGKGFCPGKFIYSKLNNKLLNANKTEMAYRLLLKVKNARLCENAQRYWRANGWHF